jgi:hypothetical protein
MTLTNHKRSVGIFSSHQEAEKALNGLRDDGFAMNQVSIIAKEPERLEQSNRIGETRVQELTETKTITLTAVTKNLEGKAQEAKGQATGDRKDS